MHLLVDPVGHLLLPSMHQMRLVLVLQAGETADAPLRCMKSPAPLQGPAALRVAADFWRSSD